jgi:hypothetical protein
MNEKANNKASLEIKTIAEKILSEALGGKIRLEAGEGLGGSNRSKVYRLKVLEGPNHAPSSIVVKQAAISGDESYDPDAPKGPAWRLFNDWAGLKFLTEVSGGEPPGPKFYGGNREVGLIVLEDLGKGTQLDHILLGNDPVVAEKALVDLAKTLGRMHALTIGKKLEFDAIREALGPRTQNNYEWVAANFYKMANSINITPHPTADAELQRVIASQNEPGPFWAYTHGDPCPDNCLYLDSTIKLVDFEFGDFRHALKDGVYGRIHFPTCWCVNRLPEHITSRMELAYRSELVKGCPEAKDELQYNRAVVESCAVWTINSWWSRLLEEDSRWGISTVRQRVLVRFDIFAKTTEELEHLEAIGMTIGDMAAKLRTIWPSEADEMPYYPAFRSS